MSGSNAIYYPNPVSANTLSSVGKVRWIFVSMRKSGLKLYLPCEDTQEAESTLDGLGTALDTYKEKEYNGHSYEMYGMEGSRLGVLLREVQAYGILPKGETPGAWY